MSKIRQSEACQKIKLVNRTNQIIIIFNKTTFKKPFLKGWTTAFGKVNDAIRIIRIEVGNP